MTLVAPLDPYLSPQAQQAVIAGLFLAAGWWVVALQNRIRDAKLRAERVSDIQRALLAEIRAHVHALEAQRMDEDEEQALIARMRDAARVPVIPEQINDRVYGAIISDVHVLPEGVIDPVVTYYRQLSITTSFATEIKRLARSQPERAIDMFVDYLELTSAARDAGHIAIRLLTASILGGEAALRELSTRAEQDEAARIAVSLPAELSEMRERLNRRSSDRSGL